MVNRELKGLLLRKLRITPQALSQRAQRIKALHGPMATEEAVYVIAHLNGIDISRILPIAIVDRIRSLVPRELPAPVTSPVKKSGRRIRPKRRENSYPLVEQATVDSSVLIGTETFPQMFVLENSIRKLIATKLSKTHGKDWWTEAVTRGIQESVQRTIDKEKRYPHRERRGLDPIFYSTFADLKEIILHNRSAFSEIILDFKWFEVQMDQVYMARNSLAHSTSITRDDRDRIRLFYRDWSRLLETAGY